MGVGGRTQYRGQGRKASRAGDGGPHPRGHSRSLWQRPEGQQLELALEVTVTLRQCLQESGPAGTHGDPVEGAAARGSPKQLGLGGHRPGQSSGASGCSQEAPVCPAVPESSARAQACSSPDAGKTHVHGVHVWHQEGRAGSQSHRGARRPAIPSRDHDEHLKTTVPLTWFVGAQLRSELKGCNSQA